MRKIIKNIIIITFLIFILSGCGVKEELGIEKKLDSELGYVEDLIFKIVNKYAKGEYYENDEFKWDYIKDDIIRINETWTQMLLDLTKVNASSETLTQYSNDLDDLLLAMSNQDKNTMISKLNSLYEKIISFEELYSNNKTDIERDKLKSNALLVFSLADREEFDNAKTQVDIGIENYKKLMSDKTYAQENNYDLNKIYIMIEEYKKSIEIKNLDLIKLKYILLVEEL